MPTSAQQNARTKRENLQRIRNVPGADRVVRLSGFFGDLAVRMSFQRISQNYGLLRSRETGEILSMAPNFDMLPTSENIDTMFAETFDAGLRGIDPDRAELYRICEENDVGITVMKGFAGGRLFDEKRSPFGVRLSPVQCIHYALTRPAVSAILCGYDTREQVDQAVAYETALDAEKDYASVLSSAPFHSCRGALWVRKNDRTSYKKRKRGRRKIFSSLPMVPALHGHLLRLFAPDFLLRQPLAVIKQQIPRLCIKVAISGLENCYQILFLFVCVIDAL